MKQNKASRLASDGGELAHSQRSSLCGRVRYSSGKAARRCDLESACAVPGERSRKSLRTITPLCARWSSRLRIVGEALQQALALQVVLVHLLFEHRQLCRHGGVWRCDRVMPSRLTARRNTAPEMPYSSFPFPD